MYRMILKLQILARVIFYVTLQGPFTPQLKFKKKEFFIRKNYWKEISPSKLNLVFRVLTSQRRQELQRILLQMCVDNQCQTFDSLNFGKCPVMNNKECGGRGVSLCFRVSFSSSLFVIHVDPLNRQKQCDWVIRVLNL